MSLRAYVPTCDAIHYLRLLGADCSKFGTLLVITLYYRGRIYLILYIVNFSIEKNKFEENRAAALAEDVNNDDVKTEFEAELKRKIDEKVATSNRDNTEEIDDAEIPIET